MSESPLDFEPPATTDDLHAAINSLRAEVADLKSLLERLVVSHNSVGQNIAWLTSNTQGLFQMFTNPDIINKMMGQMMGGMANVGQAPAGPDSPGK